MFPVTLLRRLTALIVVLALAAPAWTVCRTVAAPGPLNGMPCCHETGETSSGTVGGDCCTVQPDDPAGAPVTTPAASTLRTTSPAFVVVALPAAALASHTSHDRRAEADSRGRPKTFPHLLDAVLLI